MTKSWRYTPLLTAFAAVLALQGCEQKTDQNHIKVGVINGAEQDVAEVAKQVAKEKYGLDVELVGFSGSLLPNDATDKGELDANVFQHRPFLEQQNKDHGYKLVAVGNTFVFPMAGYSKKNQIAERASGRRGYRYSAGSHQPRPCAAAAGKNWPD
jgi:D-methionine transport system substrate-binding protein